MTPEHVEKLRAQADEYADRGYSNTARSLVFRDGRWHERRDTEFARLVAADTWERAARIPERRRDARFDEHGTTEHDTGASYYSGRAAEMYDALDEEDEAVAAEIRAAAVKEPRP